MQVQIAEDVRTQVIYQVDGVTFWMEAWVSQVNTKENLLPLVARSSTEAQCVAASLAACDLMWWMTLQRFPRILSSRKQHIPKSPLANPPTYANANWRGCRDTSHSSSGWCYLLGGGTGVSG